MKNTKTCDLATQAEERTKERLKKRKEKLDNHIQSKRNAKAKKSAFTSVQSPITKPKVDMSSIYLLTREIATQIQKKEKCNIEIITKDLNRLIKALGDNRTCNHIEIVTRIESENIPMLLMQFNLDNSNIWSTIFDIFSNCTCESKKFSLLLINNGIFDIIRKVLQKGYHSKTETMLSSMVLLLNNIISDYEQYIVENADIFLMLIRDFLVKSKISITLSLKIIDVLRKGVANLKDKIEVKDVRDITYKLTDIIPNIYLNIKGIEIVIKLLLEFLEWYDNEILSIAAVHDLIVPIFNVFIDNINTTQEPAVYLKFICIYLSKTRNGKLLNCLLEREFYVIMHRFLSSTKDEELQFILSGILSSLVIDLKSFFTSELIAEIINVAETSENFMVCSYLHSVLCNIANLDDMMEQFQFLHPILNTMKKYPDEFEIVGMGCQVTMKYIQKYKKTGFINDIPFNKVEKLIKEIEKKTSNNAIKGIVGELIQQMASYK